MARFTRLQVAVKMGEQGLIPVLYHPDAGVMKEVLRACYLGGGRLFEFTNRGDYAHEVFESLNKFAAAELPEMILGVGSVVDAGNDCFIPSTGGKFCSLACAEGRYGHNMQPPQSTVDAGMRNAD